MSSPEIPLPEPVAYRDRKIGLVLFGICTALAGLICALFIPLVLWTQTVAARQGNSEAIGNSLGIGMALYGVLAVALIWLGIGSILARRWARALLLLWSWTWLICGVFGLTVLALTLKQTFAGVAARHAARGPAPSPEVLYGITLAVCGFFFILLPLIWLLFYRSQNVLLTCEARDPVERWTDRCPLPVLAVVLWMAIGGLSSLLLPLTTFRVLPFFGTLITGGPAVAAYLVLGGAWLFGARALYRLETAGWWIAVSLTLLHALSSTLTYLRHDLTEVYQRMNYSPEMIARISSSGFMNHTWMVWAPWIFAVPLLGYLVYVRKFLPRPA